MDNKTLERCSEEYLKLLAYVTDLPENAEIRYKNIQTETGVKMDSDGKQKLRRALENCGRRWVVIRTVGYKLDSPELVGQIIAGKWHKLDNHLHRMTKTHSVLKKHLPRMNKKDKDGFLLSESVLNRIVSTQTEVLPIYKKPIQIANSEPIIH